MTRSVKDRLKKWLDAQPTGLQFKSNDVVEGMDIDTRTAGCFLRAQPNVKTIGSCGNGIAIWEKVSA